jgi:hypothetical protein
VFNLKDQVQVEYYLRSGYREGGFVGLDTKKEESLIVFQ